MLYFQDLLEFEEKDLEPLISEATMRVHYHGHYKTYVEKLNSLVKDTPYAALTLKETILWSALKNTSDIEKLIFKNASQHFNHSFYWKCLTPKKNSPSNHLINKIQSSFGSFEEFRDSFSSSALNLFGSGWTWLVETQKQKLEIINCKNAESPLQLGQVPLLCCDVWEHAYYLDYKNERKNYLESFWKLVNWSFVEKNLLG